MIKPSVSPDDAVALFNEMLQLDPAATAILIGSRQPVNNALADHPTIQNQGTPTGEIFVGLLGIVNGLFGINDKTGFGPVMAIYNDDGSIREFVRGDQ